ncbi:MAG TPA: GAF domain-containing sensor histidine kinase [Candidatus Saccharimonadales bacterium]|nr:GAF domain-containing sensor histidine kinase [Candidatus Saccharimonadales bacterium]
MVSFSGIIIFGMSNFLFEAKISFGQQIFVSIGMAGVTLLFPYFKRFFDRATNRLFYQDNYESQELFNKLNKLLVSSLDIKLLMHDSAHLLTETIKSQYVVIILNGEGSSFRSFGPANIGFGKQEIAIFNNESAKIRRHVILQDELEGAEYHGLKVTMHQHKAGMLVKLMQGYAASEECIGYIILAGKKSGNAYTQQDVQVIEAVANELVLAIQNALHFEEIQKFNVTLQQRVDNATRQLRRTNARLEALDETKDDFISMASHQLRTPLTSVKGYISMVLDGDAGEVSATQRKMLAQAFISSQRMVFLIADLLNVSRLKTGKFVIEPAPVNLAKMVAEEVAPLVETAQARGIKLTYAKPAHFPSLMLDETKTRQVIMNFVDNAIYYTKSGGHIDVQLVDKPETIELKVVDNGIGVPKAEQHHLFTKFYRARNAQKARPDGTGLGLFMAKKVILGQGGAIIFESREGKGSTFGFTFAKKRLQIIENPVDKSSTPVKIPQKTTKKALQEA